VIQRILAVALIAGFVAGLAIAALQHWTTTPMILAAEVFEAEPHAGGFARVAATSAATIGTAVGYALVLLALMLLAGDEIKPRRGVAFAACAFAATGLATGLGLAPQLPGAAETALEARQLWWILTAAATGAGLFALLRREEAAARILGVALIAAPHFFTPQAAAPQSPVPAELAASFAAASLAVQAALWILTGALAGALWGRFAARD
jgi:cobalt transporter subunit CbtA